MNQSDDRLHSGVILRIALKRAGLDKPPRFMPTRPVSKELFEYPSLKKPDFSMEVMVDRMKRMFIRDKLRKTLVRLYDEYDMEVDES